MSKRNIVAKSGKQLYLNQIFYKGVLYTSSEMQEGYAKIIDNYDIAPTGDAASPRKPLVTANTHIGINEYIFPVKFKQNINDYSFVRFKKTITEEEFVSDSFTPLDSSERTIDVVSRPINALNEGDITTKEIDYTILGEGDITTYAVGGEYDDLTEEYKYTVQNNSVIYFQEQTTSLPHLYIKDYMSDTQYITEISTKAYYTTKDASYGYTIFDSALVKVHDGDSFKYGDKEYRLWGIDSVEKGYKWYYYAYHILNNILNNINVTGIYFENVSTDSYGRSVVRVRLEILYKDPNDETIYQYYSMNLNETLLLTGLYSINYIDLKDSAYRDGYIRPLQYAQDNQYKQFSTTDYDPFHETFHSSISSSNNNPLLITNDMYIEAVRIVDSYNISPKSSTSTDFVHAVYLDDIDSVAFIGRIIDLSDTPKIFYKGVIMLKAFGENVYGIVLPDELGEGDKPNLVDAVSSGYNLLNNNMISVENVKNSYDTFNVLGLAILNTTDGIIDSPARVVSKASMGQVVALKAIINEEGFYSYNDITTTDKYGYNITLNEISYTIPGTDDTEDTIHVEETNYVLNKQQGATTGNTYFEMSISEDYEEDYRLYDILNGISIKSISLVNPDGKPIYLDLSEVLTTTIYEKQLSSATSSEKYFKLFDGSLFEIYIRVKVSSTTLIIEVIDNFNAINKYISINDDNTYTYIKREQGAPLELYSQWFLAPFGSTEYTSIQDPVHIYTKSADSSQLVKTSIWGEVASADIPLNPTDMLYTIVNNYSLSFKYIIQPKVKLCIDEDLCPSTLKGILLQNTFQEISVVIPNLSVGNPISFITDADLRTNIDFKNATRIEVFNRQLCLYGPYTKSNVLMFSKFENYDYFPLPYGIVEIEEPITWVVNYKDSFTIFGKHNIYMLSGGTAIGDCTLYKVYENLSTHLTDVHCISTVGNNLVFFNNGVGYVLVPNTYVDNPSNIKIYKLTESINNFFYNPEHYIRTRLPDKTNVDDFLNFKFNMMSYAQNNEIVLLVNITTTINKPDNSSKEVPLVVWFVYNQDYKYWKMYSTDTIDFVKTNYICEPNYNNQFITSWAEHICFSYFLNTYNLEYHDYNKLSDTKTPIKTMIDSGYLSVDTMNDKRFKDLIIELDNIDPNYSLQIDCEFFVDGSPILLSDLDVVTVDRRSNIDTNVTTDKVLSNYVDYDLHHIQGLPVGSEKTIHREFGKPFIVNDRVYTTVGRTHLRVPVYGKGRLPSFMLKIESSGFYEFINYSLIYKEKNINRRN